MDALAIKELERKFIASGSLRDAVAKYAAKNIKARGDKAKAAKPRKKRL